MAAEYAPWIFGGITAGLSLYALISSRGKNEGTDAEKLATIAKTAADNAEDINELKDSRARHDERIRTLEKEAERSRNWQEGFFRKR
jgi:hypothetical protein